MIAKFSEIGYNIKRRRAMQESPNGMAPASQAGSRGFDSRLLLQGKEAFAFAKAFFLFFTQDRCFFFSFYIFSRTWFTNNKVALVCPPVLFNYFSPISDNTSIHPPGRSTYSKGTCCNIPTRLRHTYFYR